MPPAIDGICLCAATEMYEISIINTNQECKAARMNPDPGQTLRGAQRVLVFG